jgi:hypothetical protein
MTAGAIVLAANRGCKKLQENYLSKVPQKPTREQVSGNYAPLTSSGGDVLYATSIDGNDSADIISFARSVGRVKYIAEDVDNKNKRFNNAGSWPKVMTSEMRDAATKAIQARNDFLYATAQLSYSNKLDRHNQFMTKQELESADTRGLSMQKGYFIDAGRDMEAQK